MVARGKRLEVDGKPLPAHQQFLSDLNKLGVSRAQIGYLLGRHPTVVDRMRRLNTPCYGDYGVILAWKVEKELKTTLALDGTDLKRWRNVTAKLPAYLYFFGIKQMCTRMGIPHAIAYRYCPQLGGDPTVARAKTRKLYLPVFVKGMGLSRRDLLLALADYWRLALMQDVCFIEPSTVTLFNYEGIKL